MDILFFVSPSSAENVSYFVKNLLMHDLRYRDNRLIFCDMGYTNHAIRTFHDIQYTNDDIPVIIALKRLPQSYHQFLIFLREPLC